MTLVEGHTESVGAPGADEVVSQDPATGEVWRRFATASAADVANAVGRARAAQPAWAERSLSDRVRILGRFRELAYARRHELAHVISRENGKPAPEAMAAEVLVALDLARFYTRIAHTVLSPRRFGSGALAFWRKRMEETHEPFGVVGVISPWNYPLMLPAGIILPALVAGNAVVLKPSELTPSSGEMLRTLLVESGVPEDVMQVVQGGGRTGGALSSAAVDKIFFTGSVATGRRVAHACAERLVPCTLELGGSDPAIVLADADVEHAASGILWGRFSNSGQTCVAPKRVFVESVVYDRFVAAMQRRVEALRVGGDHEGGADIGPLIRPVQRDAIAAQTDDAVQRGASALRTPGTLGGSYFAPTLLLDVSPAARVLREETFGPVLPIVRVADADEAITLANAGEFGLSASVWSVDRRKARRVAARLEAGTVALNDVTLVAGLPDVAHGGVKSSGTGRAHGVAGLEECVRSRTIVDDVFPRWRQAWWFGYSTNSLQRLDGYARLAHGASLWERLSGIGQTLKLLFQPDRPL